MCDLTVLHFLMFLAIVVKYSFWSSLIKCSTSSSSIFGVLASILPNVNYAVSRKMKWFTTSGWAANAHKCGQLVRPVQATRNHSETMWYPRTCSRLLRSQLLQKAKHRNLWCGSIGKCMKYESVRALTEYVRIISLLVVEINVLQHQYNESDYQMIPQTKFHNKPK